MRPPPLGSAGGLAAYELGFGNISSQQQPLSGNGLDGATVAAHRHPSSTAAALAQHEANSAVAQAVAAQEAAMAGSTAAQDALMGGDQFDSAVAAYGMQLKSWIDLQVEARLNQFFQDLDGEMLGVRQDCHATLSLCARLEEQVLAVTDAQARLNRKIEDGAEETGRLKALSASNNSVWERESSTLSGQLAELRRRCDRQEAESSRCEKSLAEHAELLRRLDATSSDAAQEREHRFSNMRRELETVVLAVQKLQADVESLGAKLRGEHSARISAEAAQLDKRLSDLEGLQVLEILNESRRESTVQFDQFKVRITEDVLALQQRLLTTMRAELAAAFRSKAAAISAIDEQLSAKDQTLRNQVDKVASQRTRDRIAVIERGETSGGHSRPSSPSRTPSSPYNGLRSHLPTSDREPLQRGLHIANGSPLDEGLKLFSSRRY